VDALAAATASTSASAELAFALRATEQASKTHWLAVLVIFLDFSQF